jgi:hypothetical protein
LGRRGGHTLLGGGGQLRVQDLVFRGQVHVQHSASSCWNSRES